MLYQCQENASHADYLHFFLPSYAWFRPDSNIVVFTYSYQDPLRHDYEMIMTAISAPKKSDRVSACL